MNRFRHRSLTRIFLTVLTTLALPLAGRAEETARYRLGVLVEDLPGGARERGQRLTEELAKRGWAATALSSEALERADASWPDCLILPEARSLPGSLAEPLASHLQRGGDMVALGGRAFEEPTVRIEGRWVSRSEAAGRLAEAGPEQVQFDFEGGQGPQWKIDSDQRGSDAGVELAREEGRSAAHLRVRGLSKYQTFAAPLPQPVAAEQGLWVFRAKGSSGAPQMAVELRDAAGSRWIAVVPLSQQWRAYALGPDEFRLHQGCGERVELGQVRSCSFGLAQGYTKWDGKDHELWIDEVGTSSRTLPEAGELGRLPLFADGRSYRFQDAALSATAALGAIELPGRFNGSVAVAPPEFGRSALFELLQAREAGEGFPRRAAAVLAHYGGAYAGSQWLLVGVESEGFYDSPGFADFLDRSLQGMREEQWLRRGAAEAAASLPLRQRLGVTHASGKYHFTDKDYLNEGAEQLQALGTRVIKLWFTRLDIAYPFNTHWPKCERLVEIAQTKPFREVFDRPFDTYVLETFSAGLSGDHFKDGLSPEEAERNEAEFYELTRHLLSTYRGTGKTFVLQNWEGDWAVKSRTAPPDPEPQALQGMIDLLNARQRGVDRARAEAVQDLHGGVRVLHAAEVNLVRRCMEEGRPGVTTHVLPYVNVDLASYSSYETQQDPVKFRAALEYIAAHLKPKPEIPGCRVYIGEYGLPETSVGEAKIRQVVPRATDIALAFGCPYVLYWELYCNEPIRTPVRENKDARGWWLIRVDGTKNWVWDYYAQRCGGQQ